MNECFWGLQTAHYATFLITSGKCGAAVFIYAYLCVWRSRQPDWRESQCVCMFNYAQQRATLIVHKCGKSGHPIADARQSLLAYAPLSNFCLNDSATMLHSGIQFYMLLVWFNKNRPGCLKTTILLCDCRKRVRNLFLFFLNVEPLLLHMSICWCDYSSSDLCWRDE